MKSISMNCVNCVLLVLVLLFVVMCCMNKSNEGFYYIKKRLSQNQRDCANKGRSTECFKKGGLCCDENGECLNMCNGYHKKYGKSNLSTGFYIQKNSDKLSECSAISWMKGKVD